MLPILVFGVMPVAFLIGRAVARIESTGIFIDARLVQVLLRTIALGVATAAIATLIGSIIGYRLGATEWKGKGIARIILVSPLALPPYLHALGWTTLLRADGRVSEAVVRFLGCSRTQTTEMVYSFGGAVAVLTLAYCPIAVFLVEKSLAHSSPSLVEAAQVFGANRRQAFLAARWPVVWRAAVSAGMLIFLLVAADLGVPTILKVPVFNFEVLTQLGAFNDPIAAALLTVPLLAVGLCAVAAERRLIVGDGLSAYADDMAPPRPAKTNEAYLNTGIIVMFAFVAVGMPVGAILAQAASWTAFERMTSLAVHPALNTLAYACPATVAIAVLCFVLGWAMRKAQPWRRAATDAVLAVGFAVPGTILALALLAVYDRPTVSAYLHPGILVVVALVIRYVVVGHRILGADVESVPEDLTNAAAIDGAGTLGVLWHIVLPMTGVAWIATTAVAFVLTVGEIGSTILLYPPGGETLPIALYSIEANAPRSYVAAIAVMQMVFCALPLIVAAAVISGWRARTRRD